MRIIDKTNPTIFLDFDGVITTFDSGWKIDPEKLDLLEELVNETGATIVIVSSWRRNTLPETKEFIVSPLNRCVGPNPFRPISAVIGQTDRLVTLDTKGNYGECSRGQEVKKYCEENFITNYIILDDKADYLIEQQNRLICTDPNHGLSKKNVEKGITILKRGY